MLQFFYTGATAPATSQPDPARSLGGYVSGSPLADDVLNNLFGDITPMGMQYAGPETYGLALRNLGPKGALGLKLGYVYPENSSVKLEIAAVELYPDSCGKPTMQPLANRRARPAGTDFHELSMKRATATIKIEVGANANTEVTLLVDGQMIALSMPLFPKDLTAEETAILFVARATKVNEYLFAVSETDPTCITVTRMLPGVFTGVLELDTDGTAYAETATFGGGTDNSAELGDLAKGGTLGLWFRRTLLPTATQPIPAQELEKLPIGNRHREDLEIYLTYEDAE